MSHRIQKTWKGKLKAAVPFGLGQTKPHHLRDMAKVVWSNRDNLPYAWKVLSRGVCDGCALGVAGFHDWTIEGVHLCMTRLNLLRLNTAPALDIRQLEDIARLRAMSNAQLRELGRLPYPMLREKNEKGFRRISWEAAYVRIAEKIRAIDPKRLAFFVTSRGVTNEVYYMAQKAARFLGTNSVDNAARLCHSLRGQPGQRSTGYDQIFTRGQSTRNQSCDGEPLSGAGDGTLLGALQLEKRAFRHGHYGLLVSGFPGRGHRFSDRGAQDYL
jgi:hypothetical protein